MYLFENSCIYLFFKKTTLVVYHDEGHDQGRDQGHDHDQGRDQGHDQGIMINNTPVLGRCAASGVLFSGEEGV